MAKDLAGFQRQVRQLRNLIEDESPGHEKVTGEHRDLLKSLGDVPEPAKDEKRLLAIFSSPKFDSWLETWRTEAISRLAENTPEHASTDTGPGAEVSSSNGAAQQKSMLKSAANYLLGGSKSNHSETSAQIAQTTPQPAQAAAFNPTTPQPTTSQPTTSKPTTPQSATTPPAAPQSAIIQPAPPQPAVSQDITSTQPTTSTQRSTSYKPPAVRSATSQSATSQSATTQPAASKPATSQPATFKPATEPATSQPAVSNRPPPTTAEPAASQPAASQPATSQPVTSRLATSQPTPPRPGWAQLASSTRPTQRASQDVASTQPTASTQRTASYRSPAVQDEEPAAGILGGFNGHLAFDVSGSHRQTRSAGPNSPIEGESPTSLNSDALARSAIGPSASRSAGTRHQRESPPSRSGAAAAQGHYTPPPTPGREEDGRSQNEGDDGSAFSPDDWEQENGVDEAGYVIRPPCFSSYPNTMPSKQRFPELWYEVADTIDGRCKWGLLKGKVRKNSLAFEVPTSQGSRFMLFPPEPYKYVSQIYNQKTGKQIPEVTYGNPTHIFGRDLSRKPPDQLCFSIGRGLQRKGDTFFIWYDDSDEIWYTKSEVKQAVGASVLNAFLDRYAPAWNEPRDRPGGESSPEEPVSPSPTPTQGPREPPQRQVRWPQRQADRREQRQPPLRQRQAHTTSPTPWNQDAPARLHPIHEGHAPGIGALPAWYNHPGPLDGVPFQVPRSSWHPLQPQQPSSNSQIPSAQGQAPLAPWPYTFAYPQDPANLEQPAHGVLPWLPWFPSYSQGHPQPPVPQLEVVPGGPPPYQAPPFYQAPPSYQPGSQGYRGSSHLPTPPRQMEYERPRPNGSRQASEQPNPGTAGNQTYRRGPSRSPWW